MTLLEILTVCDAELGSADFWRREPEPPLMWITLTHRGQHRATIIVSEDERVWAVELFPSPEETLVWVDNELGHTFPGQTLSQAQCLIRARELMPSDSEFTPPTDDPEDTNDPT